MTMGPYIYPSGVYHYCTCSVCMQHRTTTTTATTWTLPNLYIPKHRKPGPAR